MTNKEILEKVIRKALKGGYKLQALEYYGTKEPEFDDLYFQNNAYYYFNGNYKKISINDIIFSHNFIKAFFGFDKGLIKEEEVGCCYREYELEAWQYHLKNIILEEKPLKYLEKFL